MLRIVFTIELITSWIIMLITGASSMAILTFSIFIIRALHRVESSRK